MEFLKLLKCMPDNQAFNFKKPISSSKKFIIVSRIKLLIFIFKLHYTLFKHFYLREKKIVWIKRFFIKNLISVSKI